MVSDAQGRPRQASAPQVPRGLEAALEWPANEVALPGLRVRPAVARPVPVSPQPEKREQPAATEPLAEGRLPGPEPGSAGR
jgi:hypothetical protein